MKDKEKVELSINIAINTAVNICNMSDDKNVVEMAQHIANILALLPKRCGIMSNKFKYDDRVPDEDLSNRLDKELANRLEELSNAVTQGRDSINREFTMRVPAEMDRDAELVLNEAAARIRFYAAELKKQHSQFKS